MTDVTTNRRVLTSEAYPDSTNLRARMSIYEFQTTRTDFHDWVLGHADWPRGTRVLDVGCGPGTYLERVAAVGIDLSFGMASEASRYAPTAAGDVCALPIATASVDRVLAPHMLYHAPDLDLGASELRRVLGRGGVALIVTNSGEHFRHLVAQLGEATRTSAPIRFIDRFTLENGAPLLERHFEHVEVDHFEGEVVVADPDPVLAYADSCRAMYETQLPAGTTWDDAMTALREVVAQEITDTGAWRCVTHSGVFVCQ